MFHMEKRSRNTLIIIIIKMMNPRCIVVVVVVIVLKGAIRDSYNLLTVPQTVSNMYA